MNGQIPLTIEINGRNAVIRFVRPDTKNPLSIITLQILKSEFEILDSNPDVEKILFTGSGDTFASGANLNEVSQLNERTAREFALRGQNVFQKIYRSQKMTIAAIDGYCMGGGLDLALSCKFRIASPESVFAHPGVHLGIITGWGGTQLLPRLIGESRALEIFLTARRISASEALGIGLIDLIRERPVEEGMAVVI